MNLTLKRAQELKDQFEDLFLYPMDEYTLKETCRFIAQLKHFLEKAK